MTKEELNNILSNSSDITDEQLHSLETLAKNFPYCQIAHILIAKAYFQRDNMLSHQKIRTAGVYASDRKHLKSIVERSDTNTTAETNIPEAPNTSSKESPSGEIDDNKVVTFDELENSESVEITTPTQETSSAIPTPLENDPEDDRPDEEESLNDDTIELHEAVEPESTTIDSEQEEKTTSSSTIKSAPKEPVSEFESDLLKTLAELKKSREESNQEITKVGDKTEVVEPESKTNSTEEVQKEKASSESIKKVNPPIQNKPEPLKKKSTTQKPTRATVNKSTSKKKEDDKNVNRRKPTRAPKKRVPEEFDDEISKIKLDDTLGYKIQTSRLGEALQERDETTPNESQEFFPDLMLEYLSSRKKKKRINTSTKKKSQDIISNFIKTEPRIAPVKDKVAPQSTEDLSVTSTSFNPKLISENLAKINVRQGNIKRAILIYQELILKYPEKRTFFASEIEKLKNN